MMPYFSQLLQIISGEDCVSLLMSSAGQGLKGAEITTTAPGIREPKKAIRILVSLPRRDCVEIHRSSRRRLKSSLVSLPAVCFPRHLKAAY
jgi:hypothetical protein